MAVTEDQRDIADALELVRLRRRHLAHSPNGERERELQEAQEYLDMLLDGYSPAREDAR